MSYNVTSTKTLALDAKLRATDLEKWIGHPDLAASNFLELHRRAEPDAEGFIQLSSLEWSHDWSGMSIEVYETLLALLVGTAEIVLVWEGGEHLSGYRVANGVVTKHKVELALGAEER